MEKFSRFLPFCANSRNVFGIIDSDSSFCGQTLGQQISLTPRHSVLNTLQSFLRDIKIAPCKVIQESLGFRIPRCGFRIPCLWILYSTSVDSGFHKWLDSRFQNSIFWFSAFPLYVFSPKKLVLFLPEVYIVLYKI